MEAQEAKTIYWKWLETPKSERQPKTRKALALQLGYADVSLGKWKLKQPKYDSVTFLRSRTQEIDEALVESCKKGNAHNLKLYKQLIGELVEKSETRVKLELTAGERLKRFFTARRELEETGYLSGQRVDKVCGKPALLPQNIREDTGQD